MPVAGNDLLSLVMAKMPVFGAHGIATSVTMDISLSRKYAAARGVTENSPLRKRILALKGAKMGVISLGSAPDLLSPANRHGGQGGQGPGPGQ